MHLSQSQSKPSQTFSAPLLLRCTSAAAAHLCYCGAPLLLLRTSTAAVHLCCSCAPPRLCLSHAAPLLSQPVSSRHFCCASHTLPMPRLVPCVTLSAQSSLHSPCSLRGTLGGAPANQWPQRPKRTGGKVSSTYVCPQPTRQQRSLS